MPQHRRLRRMSPAQRTKLINLVLIFASLFFLIAVLATLPAHLRQEASLPAPTPLPPSLTPPIPSHSDTPSTSPTESLPAESGTVSPSDTRPPVQSLPPILPPQTTVTETASPDTLPPETTAPITTTPPETTAPVTDPPETNPPETKPPETKPPETKPPETKPPETKPPETKPPETKPPETKPPETKPPETKPPETKPPETKPPETKPPETKPPETKPPETKPPETKPPETDPPETTAPPVTDPPSAAKPYIDRIDPVEFADVLAKETPRAGEDYMGKILFLGDSITNGLRGYGYLPGGKECKQILFPSSGTITLFDMEHVLVYDPELKKDIPVPEAISRRQPDLLFIALGVNGIGWETEAVFRREYKELIEMVKEVSPNTTIVLQSMIPVAAHYIYPEMLDNEKISWGNLWIAQIAKEYGLTFLNIAPTMLSEDGCLDPDLVGGDGLHLDARGYLPILDYYKRHRIPGF